MALAVCGTALAASEKEEVVYAKLDNSGAVAGVYVVNGFYLDSAGEVTDLGNYATVTNLTSAAPISQNGSAISVQADAGRFYYQGDLTQAELPWDIRLTWRLNGQIVDASQLAGAAGALSLTVNVAENSRCTSSFFENYAMQITVTLDGDLCTNIKADNGTVAASGGDRIISVICLPGSATQCEITADITDFAMDPIQFAGVPLGIDLGDFAVDEYTNSITELQDGIAQLDDGANEIYDGMGELKGGVRELLSGVYELYDGMGELASGGGELRSGARTLANGVLSMVEALLQSSGALATGTSLTWSNYDSILGAMSGITDDMRAQVKAGIAQSTGLSGDALELLIYIANTQVEANSSPAASECQSALTYAGSVLTAAGKAEEAQTMLASASNVPYNVPSVQAVDITSAEAYAAFASNTSLDPASGTTALLVVMAANEAAGDPTALAAGLQTAAQLATLAANANVTPTQAGLKSFLTKMVGANLTADQTAGMQQAAQLQQLLSGFESFLSGLSQYTSGVSQAASGTGELYLGVDELYDGVGELRGGMGEFVEGMDELAEKTSDMDEQIDDMVQEITEEYSFNTDSELASFVEPSNTDVQSVQFVFMSEGIAAQETEKIEIEEVELTFWQRIIALFK